MTYQLVTHAYCDACRKGQPLTYDGKEYHCAVCQAEISYAAIYQEIYPKRGPGDNYCGD